MYLLPISNETMLMGSDTGGEWAAHYKQGNNFSKSINTDAKSEADRLFSSLSEGDHADGKHFLGWQIMSCVLLIGTIVISSHFRATFSTATR